MLCDLFVSRFLPLLCSNPACSLVQFFCVDLYEDKCTVLVLTPSLLVRHDACAICGPTFVVSNFLHVSKLQELVELDF